MEEVGGWRGENPVCVMRGRTAPIRIKLSEEERNVLADQSRSGLRLHRRRAWRRQSSRRMAVLTTSLPFQRILAVTLAFVASTSVRTRALSKTRSGLRTALSAAGLMEAMENVPKVPVAGVENTQGHQAASYGGDLGRVRHRIADVGLVWRCPDVRVEIRSR